jgi:hypothetical protein
VTASASRRRKRTLIAALTGVLVLIGAPLLGYVGWQVLQDSKAGTAAEVLPTIAFPSTPTGMLAVIDDQQVVTSLVVMVLTPGTGKGGTLVTVPTNASSTQNATDAQIPVAQSFVNGGEEGLVADVESLMRVTLNFDGILDHDTLANLLATLPTVPVALPNDVVAGGADGTTQTLFVSGPAELAPADVANVLTASDPAQTEARRLPNVRATWTGIAAAIGAGIAPEAVSAAAPTDFADFMAHFMAGPVTAFNDLGTTAIVGAGNAEKLDVGRIEIAAVVLVMAALAPSAMIAPLPTINFRIENGLTQADIDAAGLTDLTPIAVTKNVVERILILQGNVISVSSQIFTPEDGVVPDKTGIYAAGDSTELQVYTDALGEVERKTPAFQFPLVGVVIVVGKTYLADMAERAADAATSGASTDTGAATGDTTTGDTATGDASTGDTGTDSIPSVEVPAETVLDPSASTVTS